VRAPPECYERCVTIQAPPEIVEKVVTVRMPPHRGRCCSFFSLRCFRSDAVFRSVKKMRPWLKLAAVKQPSGQAIPWSHLPVMTNHQTFPNWFWNRTSRNRNPPNPSYWVFGKSSSTLVLASPGSGRAYCYCWPPRPIGRVKVTSLYLSPQNISLQFPVHHVIHFIHASRH